MKKLWQICNKKWSAPQQQIHSAIQSLPVKKVQCTYKYEFCSTINSFKYLYKYVYKCPDMASVQVVDSQGDPLDNSTDTKRKEQDEIKKIVNL